MTMFPVPSLSPAQQAAVAKLVYSLASPGSIAVLCGAAGVGKTLVLAAVAAKVTSRDYRLAHLSLAAVRDLVASGAGVPDALLIDDAHLADDGELARLVDACRTVRPEIGIVLTGQGRLLTLVSRDGRLARLVRLRVTVPPFSKAETTLLVASLTGVGALPGDDADVATTIHEIAGGIPAAIVRLAELATVVANGAPGHRLTAAEIEAIHGRLGISAA